MNKNTCNRFRYFLTILSIIFCGCTDSYKATKESYVEQTKRVVGETDKWMVLQVNDTIAVCIPKDSASKDSYPMTINLKNVK